MAHHALYGHVYNVNVLLPVLTNVCNSQNLLKNKKVIFIQPGVFRTLFCFIKSKMATITYTFLYFTVKLDIPMAKLDKNNQI